MGRHCFRDVISTDESDESESSSGSGRAWAGATDCESWESCRKLGVLKRIVCAYVVSLGSDPQITHSPAWIMDHVSWTYGCYHQLLTIQRSLLTSRRI